jgi:hypothetical protein
MGQPRSRLNFHDCSVHMPQAIGEPLKSILANNNESNDSDKLAQSHLVHGMLRHMWRVSS